MRASQLDVMLPLWPVTFLKDPLAYLDAAFADGRPAAWVPGRQLCIADAGVGRDILWNRDGLYAETSDFFDTRRGALAPRAAQIEMGRRARALLERRLETIDLAEAARRAGADWPAAGGALLFSILKPFLMGDFRPARTHALLAEIVASRIYQRKAAWPGARLLLRPRFKAAFAAERRAGVPEAERDLMDVVFACAGAEAPDEQLMEIYVSFVFAMVGSVGFALGWTLLLAVQHGATEEEPAALITEALRLYPVAWMLGRRPAGGHVVLGEAVMRDDHVVVCPYAIHRNPAYWEAAAAFRPSRWRGRADRSAWMPFGAGPHSCVATALTLDLVGRLFGELRANGRLTVEVLDARPGFGPALRPPRYRLIRG